MSKVTLTRVEHLQDLDIVTNSRDPRKDLHVYIDYITSREVKRRYRDNYLNKADINRLAKMFGDEGILQEVKDTGGSSWMDCVDWLALEMGFVNYDTKGSYRGYRSYEPTFQNNIIQFDSIVYDHYLSRSFQEQELKILKAFVEEHSHDNNEFYRYSWLGRLDKFNLRGSAVGVMPTLDFTKARHFMLKLLKECEPGVWYSTASLIAYLKENHPFFLIPEKPNVKKQYGQTPGRYGNFLEGLDRYWNNEPVLDDAPDGFERVEGRYIERFLEDIPLVMGYVDVAYSTQEEQTIYPSISQLSAFRVHQRLRQYQNDIPEPVVTVQPNFEIYIESTFYPAKIIQQLAPLADLVSEETTTILKLQKQKAISTMAQDESFDAIALLRKLGSRELPQNVVIELQEWAGQADVFTLYAGFGLLEGKAEIPQSFAGGKISSQIQIVRSPKDLFEQLRADEQLPMHIVHGDDTLKALPAKTKTKFPTKASRKVARKGKTSVALQRSVLVTIQFPDSDLFEKVRKKLLDARCVIEADRERLTLSFAQHHEPQFKEIIKVLKRQYAIKVKDIL